jgi:prophage regulatory protein
MKILKLNQVIEKTGLSRASIYAFIKKGKFPKQLNLSERAVGWLSNEIDAFIAERAEQRGQ